MKPNLTPHGIFLLHTLIAFMDGLIDDRFTMRVFRHHCGTPACAWGYARTLPAFQFCVQPLGRNGYVHALREITSAFGPDSVGTLSALFVSNLAATIHTPQQWAAHARAKLLEWGINAAPQVGQDPTTSPSQEGLAAEPAVAAPAWERVRAKMLEPVGVA